MMSNEKQQALFANESFYLAFTQKDLSILDGLWSRSAPLICVHPGWQRLTDRAEIMASWQRILENPDQPGMDFLDTEVHEYAGMLLVSCYEQLPGGICLATNGFVFEGDACRMVLHHSGACARPPG